MTASSYIRPGVTLILVVVWITLCTIVFFDLNFNKLFSTESETKLHSLRSDLSNLINIESSVSEIVGEGNELILDIISKIASSTDVVTDMSGWRDLGLKFSRKISIVDSDTISSAKLTFSGNGGSCKHSDQYGGNDCKFDWGDRITGEFEVKFVGADEKSPELGGNTTIEVDMKAGPKMSQTDFQISCQVCGQDCVVEIPLVAKKVTIKMPDCPVKLKNLELNFDQALPEKSPVPTLMTIAGDGTVRVVTPQGKLIEAQFNFEMK